VQQLALTSVDADWDMNMVCWDLDKGCVVEDWGRDNCKWNWSLLEVDHNSPEVEKMVEGVIWFQIFHLRHEMPQVH